MTRLTRRRLIALSGTVGLATLAGCGDDSVDEGPGPQAPEDEESETPNDDANDTEGAFQDGENETDGGNETNNGNDTEGGNDTDG